MSNSRPKITKEQAIAALRARAEAKAQAQAFEQNQVPEQSQPQESNQGLTGISDDLINSLSTLLPAAGQMLGSIPGGIKNVAKYAGEKPAIETIANIGAGGVESGAGLLSAGQTLARYLYKKFPDLAKQKTLASQMGMSPDDPTLYEHLQSFEKQHGLAAQSEEEGSVRNLGGLMFGGKALTSLPNLVSRSLALAAENAGRGGDPVHAAILAAIGEKALGGAARGINKAAGADNVPPPPAPPGAGGSTPSASMPSAMPAPMNAGFPVPPPPAPPPIAALTANIGAAPSGSPYMQAISNIPRAAMSIGAAIPKAAAKIPEAVRASQMKGKEIGGQALGGGIGLLAKGMEKLHIPGDELAGSLGHYIKQMSIDPDMAAKRVLFDGIEPEDVPEMQERSDAFARLGMDYGTLAELLPTSYHGAKQGNMAITSAGAKLLEKKALKRLLQEEQTIKDLKDKIYDPEKLEPQKKAAYDRTMSEKVPPEFMDKWKEDEVGKEAIKLLKSKATYRRALRNVPEDSFEYWDKVKRAIYEMESSDAKDLQKFSSDEASKARNEMVAEMEAVKPDYRIARKIAEREFTRKDIEKFFDRRNMTGAEFTKYIKSQSGFQKLMDKLEPYPEAQRQLLDMQKVLGDLINETPTARSGRALAKTSMDKARNPLDAQKMDWMERHGKKHDVALVNLTTNPKLMDLLKEHLAKKGK